ncbi:MAG: hypothetical protein OXU45_07215 [Candidatus Melainabacteria bacterium]|nr:hypothetical protein [Candidatus Melainabacteria bacterium]
MKILQNPSALFRALFRAKSTRLKDKAQQIRTHSRQAQRILDAQAKLLAASNSTGIIERENLGEDEISCLLAFATGPNPFLVGAPKPKFIIPAETRVQEIKRVIDAIKESGLKLGNQVRLETNNGLVTDGYIFKGFSTHSDFDLPSIHEPAKKYLYAAFINPSLNPRARDYLYTVSIDPDKVDASCQSLDSGLKIGHVKIEIVES